jgi:hypothetical protein
LTVKSASLFAPAAIFLSILGATDLSARDFDKLSGSWNGGGTVQLADGTKERLRCRASYQPSGATLGLRLTCASDSYKFELHSSLTSNDGKLSGSWIETTRKVQGSLSGTVSGDLVRINVYGPFSANLSVRTANNSQSVTIQSPGSAISNVSISLRK